MKKIFSLILLCGLVLFTSCKKNDATVIAVDQVSLNKTTIGLVIGTTETLVATISPANADVKDINWTSCDEKVAKVSNTGVVTAIGVGKATITAVTVSGGKSASCVVLVTADRVAVTGITLDKTTLTLSPSDKSQLISTIAPADATNSNVKWSSDDDKIATVNATGEVTAVAIGTAKITVTTEDGDKTAVCTVTVGVATPPYVYYGAKNKKTVYVDGANIKYIDNGGGYVKAAFRVGEDFYGLVTGLGSVTPTLYKNGEVTEGKIPAGEVINNVAGDANAIYACGFVKPNSLNACWKNGTLLFSVKGGSGFNNIAVLKGDVFVGRVSQDRTKLELYKNNATTIIETTLPSGVVTISNMVVSQDKIYITFMCPTDGKAYLYSCDGSTLKKETERTAKFVQTIKNVDNKNNFFTLIEVDENTSSIYKNMSWETALPQLSLVDGFEYPVSNINVIVEGNDTYTYGGCQSLSDAKKKEVYYWKNALNPVRMPSDTVYFVIHKTK